VSLAARQYGLVTSAQLTRLGLSRAAVSKRVRAGRLHPRYRGVYAVGHPRLSQEGEWLAAVLAAGPGAALGHLASASLQAVWRRRVDGIDVVVPGNRRPRKGFRLHTCRNLDPRDVTRWRGIPVTTIPRTLVDLTDVLDWPALAGVIHEAAYRKRFNVEATRAAMARATGRRNLATLEKALAAHAAGSAGTRSGAEDRFLAIVIEAGLPEPRVNTQVEVDLHWPELGLCVEVDGPGHGRPRTTREDAARDHALAARGHRLIRLDADAPASEIVAALRGALPAPTEPTPHEAEPLQPPETG
jgi:very-short-patch-repair endonuclease